ISMPQAFHVPAKGAGEIRSFIVENPFKEDTWVSSIEIRPGDPSVVHHVIVQVMEPNQGRGAVFVRADCNNCDQSVAALKLEQAALVQQQLQQTEAFVKAVAQGQRGGGGFGVGQGSSYNDVLVRLRERQTGKGAFTTMEAVYAPGSSPLDFRFTDSAKLIK